MTTTTPNAFASHAADLAAHQVTRALDRMMVALANGQDDVTAFLKLAGRNAAILARHALQVPEDRAAVEAILDRVIAAAELADDQAIQVHPTMLGYLVITTTCIDWLAKLEAATRREQRRAARDTQQISRHFPAALPAPSEAISPDDDATAARLTPWLGAVAHAPASAAAPGVPYP